MQLDFLKRLLQYRSSPHAAAPTQSFTSPEDLTSLLIKTSRLIGSVHRDELVSIVSEIFGVLKARKSLWTTIWGIFWLYSEKMIDFLINSSSGGPQIFIASQAALQ
jgi:hypothetical protein